VADGWLDKYQILIFIEYLVFLCLNALWFFLCIAHIILRYILLIPDFKIWADYGHFLFKILNFCLPTSKKGAFSSSWEGPLVPVVVTGITQSGLNAPKSRLCYKPGLKVLHVARVACCGWRTL
jgi:hypothetical protein